MSKTNDDDDGTREVLVDNVDDGSIEIDNPLYKSSVNDDVR